MDRRHLWPLRALAALSVLLVLALVASGMSADAPLVAPVLVLLAPLLLGRYVGETRIARMRDVRRPRARRPRREAAPALRAAAVLRVPRGGSLLASALAVRPPPRSPAV